MADFYLKVDDTRPILEARLVDSNGKPINISTATSVTFNMRRKSADPFISIACTIIDDGSEALRGRCDVPWEATASSTSEAGSYKAGFKVVFPGPLTMSVPNKGCKAISIEEDC